jgi:hypothetical protein
VTDFRGRTLAAPGFTDDDGTADPAVTAALAAHRRGELTRDQLYPVLAGARVVAAVVAVLGEAGTTPAGGDPAGGDKDSDMALVTLTAPDGAKALPVFTSIAKLAAWSAARGLPTARPVPVPMARAAEAALFERASVLLIDEGTTEACEISGTALHTFATGEDPTAPDSAPELAAALDAAARAIPELAALLGTTRVTNGDTSPILVLTLRQLPTTDLAPALRRLTQSIAANPTLRPLLPTGLELAVLAP